MAINHHHHHQPPSQPPRTDLFGDPIDHHPTWFNQSAFLNPSFTSESYISDLRTFVPFETLRSELQSHLTSLKTELVELINRDYADFVNLSSKLVDVDGAVLRMRAPLVEIREKVLGFRSDVEMSLSELKSGLRERNVASEAREVLELLIDTAHVVSKVEKLIKELHSVPVDGSNGDLHSAEKSHLSNGVSKQHSKNGTDLRETQSMLLERIASEMNRLKFYFAHAKDLPFIENMEKRIQNASSLLDTSLGHCFVDGLTHKDENAVYNCLRAYAAVDNTRNAEDIFRSTVVAPLVQKVIPYSSSGVVSGSAGDELEEDYKQIKNLIAEDCTFLLQISSTENSGFHVFSFLANSILKEVLWAIQHGKPGAFSPGRPTEFLKNYKSSLGFLADLEGYCPSRSAVANFRAEAVYVDFMKQWNIGVYFSLRFQEIAGSLDSALVGSKLTPIQKSDSEHGLTLKQSLTLLECLKSCWREDVLLISISDKFLRLTLQLISRYVNWLSAGLSARKTRNAGSNSSFEWAVSATPEDLIYVIHDLDHLAADVCDNFIGHVFELLKSCSTEEVDLVKDSILQGGKSLKDLVPSVIDSIIDTLAEKCGEEVQQLQGIVAAYRMTKKPPPVRHSHYVSGVLRPLKVFLDGERATTYLTEDTKGKLVQGAAFKITGRYYELAADTVNTARKTEISLQRIREGARHRQGASTDTSGHNVTETDKICMQLFLDIQEYGRNLATLGVEAAKIPSYTSLWQLVAPQDRQAEIRF